MTEDGNENSIYDAPQADLQPGYSGPSEILAFKRFPAWAVLLLMIVTLRIYGIYWLYTRGRKVNEIHRSPIPEVMLFAPLAVLVAAVLLSLYEGFYGSFLPPSADLVINLISLAAYLTLLFTIRNRLEDIARVKLNGVLTFFFSCIYLQYKINEAIDRAGISRI